MSAVKPEPIKQSEISAVLEAQERARQMDEALQKRLRDGAPVEGGRASLGAILPEWVTEDYSDLEYELCISHAELIKDHRIAVTRAEYIALKGYLAQMRGYAMKEAA